ncbi:EpsG family protein [Rheinheimera fenheensis]|uniref:EpsG family protein n=1 Tax=Rheinheimera fenheensis TaxID=3152295 RepID=UPI0032609105
MILLGYLLVFVPLTVFLAFLPSYKGLRPLAPVCSGFIICLVFGVLILRDPNAPADSINYSVMFDSLNGFKSVFDVYHKNYTYSFIQYVFKSMGLSFESFSILFSILCFSLSAVGLRLIFSDSRQFTSALAFFVLTSTFVLLYTNVVRQGLALGFTLILIGCLLRRCYILSFFIAVLAVFSHFSALIFCLAIIFSLLFPSSKKRYLLLVLLVPILPVVGSFALSVFSSIGGLFSKIDSFAAKDYSNTLVYIKVAMLYGIVLFIGISGLRASDSENNRTFKFLSDIYLYLTSVVFLTLPILLLSSRFLYYAGALLPVLFVHVFFSWKAFNINIKAVLAAVFCFVFGYFVYFYKSTGMQLGLY